MTTSTPPGWEGTPPEDVDAVTALCDALLANLGLLTLVPRPGPQHVKTSLTDARAQVRHIAQEILDDLRDDGYDLVPDEIRLGTVDGIRPHKPMTDAEHELARRFAEQTTVDPEQVRLLRGEDTDGGAP